jgi:hypothetical protein
MRELVPNEPIVQVLRGDTSYDAPSGPGLYAWYYSPLRMIESNQDLVAAFSSLLEAPAELSVRARARYGIVYCADTQMQVRVGGEEQQLRRLLVDALQGPSRALVQRFPKWLVPHFARPIYIGLARRLRERVYFQHFAQMVEFWSPESAVSRLLQRDPEPGLGRVMATLGLPHTFALDARVRGIRPEDLKVHVLEVSDDLASGIPDDEDVGSEILRPVEQLLQLLADPVCGRR